MTENTEAEPATKTTVALTPEMQRFEDRYRQATMLCKSSMLPKAFENPSDVMIAYELAERTGLAPFAVCQNLAIINGKPSFFGDAIMAILQKAQTDGVIESIEVPGLDAIRETMSCRVIVQRKGNPHPFVGYFDKAMAERARLWGKTGPWTDYPERMIQCRAIMFASRLAVPDRLTGIGYAEEQMDIERIVTVEAVEIPDGEEPKTTSEQIATNLRNVIKDDEVEKFRESLDCLLVQLGPFRGGYAKAAAEFFPGKMVEDLDAAELAETAIAVEKALQEARTEADVAGKEQPA